MIGRCELPPERKPSRVRIAVAVATVLVCLALGLTPALAQAPTGCPAPRPEPLQTPLNLTLVKRQLIYYRCTRYDADLAKVLHEALRRSFSETFEVDVVAAPLCLAEERLANALYTTKYTNAVWNLEGAAAWRQSMAPIHTT